MDERRGVTRFELREELGRGGGGTVVRAFDAERGVEVAVKRLHAASAEHEAALRREHRLLRALSHPGIVLPSEIGRDGDGLFLVSPLVQGEGFVEHARGSWVRLANALPQLLAVLRYLHERGVAHGDLSPGNVLVEPDGRVRVIDFGLAGHGEGPRGGTPGYLAPERSSGGPPSPAADLYALGKLVIACVPERAPLEPILTALEGPAETRPTAAVLERELLPRLGTVASPALSDAASDALVGRDALIAQTIARLRAGRSVVLEGRSAIGKSALLDAIVEALGTSARRTSVLRAWPRPGSRVPFETLDQLLESVRDAEVEPEVAERLGRHSSAAARWTGRSSHALRTRAELQSRLFGERDEPAVSEDVARVLAGVERPVLVVDDLQWADSDSAACLAELIDRDQAILLAARRPGPSRMPIEPLAVPPLAPDEMRRLLRARGVAKDRADAIVRDADGVPGLAVLAARFARGARPLDEAIAHRVASLPDVQRRALALVHAAGAPIATSTVGLDATEALVLGGLVSRVGESVDLAHDVLREPIARALGDDWLRAARLERATEPDVPSTARVDAYLALGDVQRAAAIARTAAAEATALGAFHTAAESWAVVARVDPEARRAWARACVSAGLHDEAARLWAELELEASGSERRSYTLARAHALLASRRVAEGSHALREALGTAPAWRTLARFLSGPRAERPALDPEGAELALRNAALAGYFDALDGVRLALDARSAFGPGTEDLGAWADSLLAFFARFAGLPRVAQRYRSAAAAWRSEDARPIASSFPGFLDGYDALRAGRTAEAVTELDRALERVAGTEDERSFEVRLVLSLRTSAVIKRQRIDAIRAAIARFESATRRSDDDAMHVHVETARALCSTWQGRWEDAVARLERARRAWPSHPRTVQHVLIEAYAAWPRALLGDASAAHEDLARALRGQRVLLASAYGPILLAIAAAVELAAHGEGHSGARRARALARAWASAQRPSWASGLARRVVARITHGWDARGWDAAERHAAAEDQPIDRALARYGRGESSEAGGEVLRAEARQWLAEVGASPRLFEKISTCA